jgi:hypothetical protein
MAEVQGRRPDDARRAGAWRKPWAVAATACASIYVLVWALGGGRFRGEFLGAS